MPASSRVGLVAALLLACTTDTAARDAARPGAPVPPVEGWPEVVRLEVEGCGDAHDTSGVATLIGDGLAVTAGHVVARGHHIVASGDRPGRAVGVVALDPRRDLALVRLHEADGHGDPTGGWALPGPPPGGPAPARTTAEPATVRHATEETTSGATVTVDRADRGTVAAVVVRTVAVAIADIDGSGRHRRDAIELAPTVPLEPGDSGAPVVDADGRMVGLVFAVSTNGTATAWATAASEIERFVDDAELAGYRCDPGRSRLVGRNADQPDYRRDPRRSRLVGRNADQPDYRRDPRRSRLVGP
ncbi:MAG: trypsin-like peptidase domain-containing protein [Actinomycetota bacterium]|nr:trypsin-like peptidase domain-containing protein [Actinomycetota bacterium]